MFSGITGKACFGPAEINIMQRAMSLAERALRLEGAADLDERLRHVALSILNMTARGHSDPLILSAHALREQSSGVLRTFYPYERRPLARRAHARRWGHPVRARKIA